MIFDDSNLGAARGARGRREGGRAVSPRTAAALWTAFKVVLFIVAFAVFLAAALGLFPYTPEV